MDYNDNEEATLNTVNNLSQGVWRGDTRACEQGQVIFPGPTITRPVNMNQVDNQSPIDLSQPIETTNTVDQPISKPVIIPSNLLILKESEESNQSDKQSGDDNQPIKIGFTNSQPIRLSFTSSSDSSDSSKTTTWGQVKGGSPTKCKKDTKCHNAKNSPDSSPTKNRNKKAMTSWKDISPTKSNSSSDLEHSSHSNHSNEYTNRIFRFSTSRMKDFNGSTSGSEIEPGKETDQNAELEHKVTNHDADKKCNCLTNKGSPCKKSCSCNCSNNCTSHVPGNQNALANSNTSLNENDNGSPKKEKSPNGADDACDNEYFYEDDFTVQFDTNLRETSVTPIDSDPSVTILDFPNMVSGSYLHFNTGGSSNVSFNNSKASSNVSLNNMRVSNIINNREDRGQYDSEFSGNSGSRNSTMEMSSSDRDMMGSSDMIDLSDGPLFTPTPTHILSTDSLDKTSHDVVDGELSGSNESEEANLNIDCCPRKEEYFLSFDGSHSRVSSSETDISLSMTSHESYQGHWIQSEASATSRDSGPIYTSQGHDASNEFSSSEGAEESTDSFHMCFNKLSPRHKSNQYAGRENLSSRMLKRLVPLKETIVETGDSSEDENTRTSTTLTAGSKDVSSASPQTSPRKKLKIIGEQVTQLKGKKSGQLYLVGIGKPEDILRKAGVHSHTLPRVKQLLSWKQLKNFKKGDPAKCASLPELNTSTSWQSISNLKCRKLSDISQSFHGKRHSASLLEFYQRMKSQSNPVSPETMNNLEQIMWPNFIGVKTKPEMSDSSGSSQECAHCRRHNFVDGLPDSGVKGYSNKRICDWLKGSRPNSLACQTGAGHECVSKETLISPQTVTLWCGTKTVASQFPPLTKDCAIQTFQTLQSLNVSGQLSVISKKDQSLQTSDFEEEEILSILSDNNYEDYGFLKSNEGIAKELQSCPDMLLTDTETEIGHKIHRSKSADGYRNKTERIANCTNKSYQERTSVIGRSKSAGRLGGKCDSPVRRMGLSKHYSQQSLPDIAFLSSSITIEKDESKDSLFDAMKIDLPVPVTIIPKTELEQFNIYQQTANPCQHKSRCCVNKCKNKGTETEIGSSCSGISSSSASSGIDPGYCDCKSRSTESPQNDLERLIFFPPHTEDKIKSSKDCCGSKKRAKSLPSRLSECANPAAPKIEKYTNEIRPQITSRGQGQCRISEKWISAGKKQELEGSDNLYALEEEQTPVASPDQPCCHRNIYQGDNELKSGESSDSGAKCSYFCGERDFTESDFYRAVESDKIIVVGDDYYRGLSLDSNSSSGSSVPNMGRKPLKSCLRKKNRGLRTRSMSATDTMALNFDDLEEKVKNHRHSYGCDEVYIVSDEHGQLMMYQADDSAEPVMFYLGKDGECHMTEGHRNHMENFGSLANFNIEAADSIHASDSSSEREGSSKRKSVSFASEVSFQSISPAVTPKHQSHVAAGKTSDQQDGVTDRQEVRRDCGLDGPEVSKDSRPAGQEVSRDCGPDGQEVSKDSRPAGQEVSRDSRPAGQEVSRDCVPAGQEVSRDCVPAGQEVSRDCGPDGKEVSRNAAQVDDGKIAMDTLEDLVSKTTEKPREITKNLDTTEETSHGLDEPGNSSSSDSAPDEFHVTMDTNDNLWFEDVLMEKIGLLMSVTKAADVLYAHFENSKDTFDKLRLGNTSETPELGEIVLTRLCTTLTAVLGDGLKHHLAGFQVFGSVQITVWKVVEASVEIVPQTRSLCDLVHKVKQTTYLTTHQQKFDAFIFGLLNLRVLDFWLGYLRQKEDQLCKFYNSGAILVHSDTALKTQYDYLITSIQKLCVLPFHMDMEYIQQKALTDLKLKSQEMIGSFDDMATNSVPLDSSPNQRSPKEVSSVLEITASKALNWLAKAALPKKKAASDCDLSITKSETFESTSQMIDSNSTANQISGSFSFHEDADKDLDLLTKQVPENLSEMQQLLYTDARISSVDCDPIISPSDSLRSSQSSQSGFVSLFSTMAARLGENSASQSLTQSMTSSASSLVTRLTGLQFGSSSQKTYKKGVTEYKFADDNEHEKKSTETAAKGAENVNDVKDKSGNETDKAESDVKLREKNSDESSESRNSKRVSFDIVDLFDKLLLPSAKQEKKEVKPVSKIPRPTSRWSWSFGLSKVTTSSPKQMPKASTDTDLAKRPNKSVTKSEPVVPRNEHFPKRSAKVGEKLTKTGKPSRLVASSKVSAPPKPPRLVQSAPSAVRKSSSLNTSPDKQQVQYRSKKNTSTL